jgi:pimeloyl-ACP methyl ester carboxylesterase
MDGFLESVEHGMLVRTRGDDRAPTVVYVHGLGESGRCFEALAADPALAHLRHVIPDLPGYGRSPWPAQTSSLIEVADHVAAWLASRGGPAPPRVTDPTGAAASAAPVVVGHSMGGVISRLTSARPERRPARKRRPKSKGGRHDIARGA